MHAIPLLPRLATIILVVLSVPCLSAAEKPAAFHRWAVLAAPEIHESGLSDLLTAQLTAANVELVEREQLDAVTREIELSKLLGADGAAQRLKVGQLTKADALILLSVVEHDKKKFVKLVISDCRYGSRLRLEHFPFAADRADKLADEIALATADTRKKFARGVERIVAVSPFLSKNLTHEFDHLQFGFAALLGQGLSERPGVAVLEIEEARAIGEELTRATAEIDRRSVPLFVECEFEVAERAASGMSGAVRFAVRIRSGGAEPETIEQTERTLAEASSWLIESLPNKIAARQAAPGSKSLTRTEQRIALTRRADQFTQVAAYPQSAALREAAVLLEPDDWEQRVRLIADLTRRINQMIYGNSAELSSNKLREDEEFKRRCVAELHSLIAGVEGHTERVLAARVLNLREASYLLSSITLGTTLVVSRHELGLGLRKQFHEFYWRCLAQAVRLDSGLRQGIMHPVLSEFGGQGTQQETPLSQQHDEFAGRALQYLIGSLPLQFGRSGQPQFDDTETIRDLERLFADVLLPDQFSFGVLLWLTRSANGTVPSLVISKRIPADEVIKFYERLRESRQPLFEFYARAGLVALKSTGAIKDPVTPADLAELDWLDGFVAEWQKQHPKEASIGSFGARILSELRSPLTVPLPKGATRKVARPIEPRLEGTDPYPRLAFEPLDMTANWTTLSPCGAGRDLVWSWESVGVLTAPGQLKTIVKVEKDPTRPLLIDQDSICSVVWDGEFIWVAGSRSGVRVFNLEGGSLGQLLPSSETPEAATTTSGLPPVELFNVSDHRGLATMAIVRPLWLHPLDKGRCFVAGRFGKDFRRWFGVIERHPANGERPSWQFTRWHQLTKQAGTNFDDDDLDVNFPPVYVTDYVNPSDQRRWLLLGRPTIGWNATARRPLGFLVDTGKAALFPKSLAAPIGGPYRRQPLTVGDNLIFPGMVEIVRLNLADGNEVPAAQSLMKLELKPVQPGDRTVILSRSESLRPQLLPVDEWLYNPGLNWRRINTRSWEVEPLTTSPVSLRYEFESYAVSAHYGFVAWNHGDPLCRVHVDLPSDHERPLSWLYPFVPAAARERHHRAIEEIRRLGGQVDAVMRDAKSSGIRRTELWRTVVWLTDTWQGGDDGLRHLTDLHNLRDLLLERAPITDDGSKTISRLQTLNVLHVTETKATTAGVQSLADLPELSHLWLENHAGRAEIGDEALRPFQGKLKLFQLTLGGPGFTDKSLSQVLDIPRLFNLRLIDTNTTPAAIAAAKQKRPGLRFLSEMNY
ncbi:MAG: CsgG/HfaB family protein [Planctomycetaceae bacterium]